ncbi:uncharacterized protein FYW49_016982 [Xenentodon cancila]
MAASFLWIFCIGAFFFSCNAQEAYDNLPASYKKGVDLALEKLNSHSGIKHFFLFFTTVTKSDFEAGFDVSYIYHHFYLKATTCQKGAADTTACPFRNDRPLIDCAVCYKTYRGEIEQEPKPYIHCIHKPALTEEMTQTRSERCSGQGYTSGGGGRGGGYSPLELDFAHTHRKMAAGLLFLLCGAAVLQSAGSMDPYNELPVSYMEGVDLVLEQLNSHSSVQHHFRFLKSVSKSEIEGNFGVKYLYHHFYLKPTVCPKGTTELNPQRCPFRTNRPLMDCAICYKTLSDQMEAEPTPYVHCMQKPRLTQEMKTTRLERCKKMSYNSGAPTLLAVSTG